MDLREIPGAPGYFASADGKIYSSRFRYSNGELRMMKTWMLRCGYLGFAVKVNGKNVNLTVHRSVAKAWLGVPEEGMDACHNDGNRTNNSVSNLRWDTKKGNHKDRLLHGTQWRGEEVYNAKLTIAQVRRILDAYRGKAGTAWGLTKLAKEFGVHTSTVKDVAMRRTWHWVDPEQRETEPQTHTRATFQAHRAATFRWAAPEQPQRT